MQASKQIAKNYAQALIELANNDLILQEAFLSEIDAINESINQTKGAKELFEIPTIPEDEKKDLIKKLFDGKISQKILNFMFLLIDNNRFNTLSEIQNQLIKLVNKAKGIVVAEVSSAFEIDSATLESLRQKLESLLVKEKITIKSKIEPDLIGGLKVKINDLVYDGSIKGRLENLKGKLG